LRCILLQHPKSIDFLTLSHRGIANFLTAMEFDIFQAYEHAGVKAQNTLAGRS
jgi:hypothetical protein